MCVNPATQIFSAFCTLIPMDNFLVVIVVPFLRYHHNCKDLMCPFMMSNIYFLDRCLKEKSIIHIIHIIHLSLWLTVPLETSTTSSPWRSQQGMSVMWHYGLDFRQEALFHINKQDETITNFEISKMHRDVFLISAQVACCARKWIRELWI